MLDFPVAPIAINSGSDRWGPFSFDFSKGLPAGDPISAAVVTSYLGDLETSALLVEFGSVEVVDGAKVQLRLQYPGAGYLGNHELRFALTLDSGAKHRFAFGYVVVQ
jgi:hypothetical protein